MTLLTARDIREIAADIGLRPTKQKGQNFVIDPNTVRSIVASATLGENSSVVEIGPGLGSLTLGLLEAGHQVTAVEIDEVLAARLPATVAKYQTSALGRRTEPDAEAANFEIVNADALKVTELPSEPDALVANLPYNVAVPVLLHFLEIFPSLKTVLVMVQLEVAERLAAGPGSRTYGVPSVKAQWYGDVTLAGRIGKNVFWPAPNIDSGLVHINVERRHRDPDARRRLFGLVDAAFAQRRKTLRAALSSWAGSPQRAEELLLAADIDPRTRGEALGVADFERLAATGATAPNSFATPNSTPHTGKPAVMSAQLHSRPTTLTPVKVQAPGKINVHLGVGGSGDDGYHELATVFQALNLHETLTLIPGGSSSIVVGGRYGDDEVPKDESNFARKAINHLIAALEDERDVDVLRDLDIVIDKQVPVAGGMGGGSADAAAALCGAAHLIGGVDDAILHDCAVDVGADVAFLLRGGTAIGYGRGEKLSPVLTRGQFHWVMATSARQLSTPAIYSRFDELTPNPEPAEVPAEVLTALAAGDPDTLASAAGNDLTDAAISALPELAEVMEAGRDAGALLPLLSGSGPTIGFLARDAHHALDLAVLLQATRGVKEALRTTGPAPGAHVVSQN